MIQQGTRRGGEGLPGETDERSVAPRRMIALLMLCMFGVGSFTGFGGCAQAEKTRYVRHLTTVVEPSAHVPEEATLTFDIDRKKVEGALVRGVDR